MNASRPFRRPLAAVLLALAFTSAAPIARASDHLDTPTVEADPRADIADLYAWMAPDGRRVNLVMTVVGHTFSDAIRYVFHVDSAPRFGETAQTRTIECRFKAMNAADCNVDGVDRANGDASAEKGLASAHRRFRVFAGLRDDPFFNNVRGSRHAFDAAKDALLAGAPLDASACPHFDAATLATIRERWTHTEGGAPKNFLAGWSVAAIVVSIDVAAIAPGGRFIGVWATTESPQGPVDRAGRPMIANSLLAPLVSELGDRLKEDYNRATPATSARFVAEIQKSLALYDGYDGRCGNQLLYQADVDPDMRYGVLAKLLADDRLWIDSTAKVCTQLFGVERAELAGDASAKGDCGGRSPNVSAANVFRSLLANGTPQGNDDGLVRDERTHSDRAFPFLAAPGDAAANP